VTTLFIIKIQMSKFNTINTQQPNSPGHQYLTDSSGQGLERSPSRKQKPSQQNHENDRQELDFFITELEHM